MSGVSLQAWLQERQYATAYHWRQRPNDECEYRLRNDVVLELYAADLVAFMHVEPRRLLQVIGIALAGQALLVLEIVVTVGVIGFAFSPLQPLIVEGSVKFIRVAFFFVPGLIGASESVHTLLFQSLGMAGAIGLTMALVRRSRARIAAAVALAASSML